MATDVRADLSTDESDTPVTERTGIDSRTPELGVRGGIVATAVMTVYRMSITNSLPPTAHFWAKYVGSGDPEDYPVVALVLHLLYGVGGGLAFSTLFEPRARGPEVRKERRGALWGVLYGAALSVFGARVVLGRLLGMDLAPDERWIFHVSHAVYGLTLGTWIGSSA